jgi:hypothetical protein
VCTTEALAQGYCTQDELGRFILDLPQGKTINDTSFWSARVLLSSSVPAATFSARNSVSELELVHHDLSPISSRQNPNLSPDGILSYSGPIHYDVTKTGYYCVGAYVCHLYGYASPQLF